MAPAEPVPTTPEPATRRRGPWVALVAALSVVALYLWDDVFFAAPVIALRALLGPLPAFVLGSVVYAALSFAGALLAVRAYDRRSAGRPSRLARWLAGQEASRRGTWGRRLLGTGRIVGFVASSFLLGGIVTTWLVRYAGRREGIRRVAFASSVVFGVTFVGFYTGLAQAVVSL